MLLLTGKASFHSPEMHKNETGRENLRTPQCFPGVTALNPFFLVSATVEWLPRKEQTRRLLEEIVIGLVKFCNGLF